MYLPLWCHSVQFYCPDPPDPRPHLWEGALLTERFLCEDVCTFRRNDFSCVVVQRNSHLDALALTAQNFRELYFFTRFIF